MDNLLNPLPTVLFPLQEDVPCSNKHMYRTPSMDEINPFRLSALYIYVQSIHIDLPPVLQT